MVQTQLLLDGMFTLLTQLVIIKNYQFGVMDIMSQTNLMEIECTPWIVKLCLMDSQQMYLFKVLHYPISINAGFASVQALNISDDQYPDPGHATVSIFSR